MKNTTFVLFGTIAALFSLSLQAQESPVGLWKNIDDVTGKPKALIRITEVNGELSGKIEQLFLAPGEEQHPRCVQCEGEKKDQPVVGMVILTGLKKNTEGYDGGTILDPGNGKVYKSKLTLAQGKLNVRGYIGFSWLGRSQIWIREQ